METKELIEIGKKIGKLKAYDNIIDILDEYDQSKPETAAACLQKIFEHLNKEI